MRASHMRADTQFLNCLSRPPITRERKVVGTRASAGGPVWRRGTRLKLLPVWGIAFPVYLFPHNSGTVGRRDASFGGWARGEEGDPYKTISGLGNCVSCLPFLPCLQAVGHTVLVKQPSKDKKHDFALLSAHVIFPRQSRA